MKNNQHSNTDNMPTKYHIVAYAVLLSLFAVSLLQNSFHIFILINMVVIFGAALLLNTIQV